MSEFEVLDPVRQPPRLGGAREGAGRKPRDLEADMDTANYGKARARHEAAKADMAELELKIKTGEYVSRAAVRQASAQAMAAVAQALRSIPDNLERHRGITPDIAEEIQQQVDAALNDLADTFQMMVGDEETPA